MCLRCKSDRPAPHTKENCAASQCTNCRRFFHTAVNCRKKPRHHQLNSIATVQELSQQMQDSTLTQTMSPQVIQAMNTIRGAGLISAMQAVKGGIHLMDSATPQIVLTIIQANRTGQVTTLPDTGSTFTAISSILAAKHKLKINKVPSSAYDIRDANNQRIEIIGTTPIKLLLNTSQISTTALISDALPEDQLILGWTAMRNLNIISSHFLNPCTNNL